jgi:hypothetical protein
LDCGGLRVGSGLGIEAVSVRLIGPLRPADARLRKIDAPAGIRHRIITAEGAGASFAPRTPPFDDVAAFVRARVLGSALGGRHRVEVIVEASAEAVSARVGRWAEVRARTPKSCTLMMETDSLDGPLFALGSIGAEFTVITPLELATMAADWGARFVRAGNNQP